MLHGMTVITEAGCARHAGRGAAQQSPTAEFLCMWVHHLSMVYQSGPTNFCHDRSCLAIGHITTRIPGT